MSIGDGGFGMKMAMIYPPREERDFPPLLATTKREGPTLLL